jgi:ABC-2 type transport system permease protein
MVALPIIVIVVIGAAFGGAARVEVGVVAPDPGPTGTALLSELDEADGVTITRFSDSDAADRAIRRAEISAAVVIPPDLEDRLADGQAVELPFLARSGDQAALTARVAISGAIAAVGADLGAARVIVDEVGGSFPDVLAEARADASPDRGPGVEVVDVGGGTTQDLSRFSLVAPQNLVLFVFITSLIGGAFLVSVRRAGVLRRVASMRPSTANVLAGLATGWFAMALAQSALILVIGAVVFGVDWGDPVAAALLTVAFAGVGASAGLLIGAVGQDEDKVGSLAPIVGIVLGALGGCMVPIEVFPPAMVAVAHAVPHYWAIVAWQRLVFDGEGVAAIVGPLVVLAGFVAVLLTAATTVLRRQVSST